MPEDPLKKSMDAAKAAHGSRRPPLRSEQSASSLRVPEPIKDDFGSETIDGVEQPITTAIHLGFLGTGQGGARIAQAFWHLGYRHIGAFNTTDSDFQGLDTKMPRYSLDIGGAGKDMKMALDALLRHEEDAVDLMIRAWGNDVDYAMICISLGGGTGSGTGPKLVDLARRYMTSKGKTPRVGAVVSLPAAEGQIVSRNAVLSLYKLIEMKVSPLVIIDNKQINEIYNRPGMTRLFPLANEAVANLLHVFNRKASIHSDIISFDRSELVQLLDGGIIVMGESDIKIDTISGPADVSKSIREELARNVLAAVDLGKGKKAACLFVGSRDVLDLFPIDYFEAGFHQLDRIVGSKRTDGVPTTIHRGIYYGHEPGLQCYTLISELEPPRERIAELARVGGLTGRNDPGLATFLGVG